MTSAAIYYGPTAEEERVTRQSGDFSDATSCATPSRMVHRSHRRARNARAPKRGQRSVSLPQTWHRVGRRRYQYHTGTGTKGEQHGDEA